MKNKWLTAIPADFDPENSDRTPPEGFDPGSFEGMMPDGAARPERPEEEEMPDFDFSGSFAEQGETTSIDIADAHISVEIENGKEAGSLDDVTQGTFVTITMNGKGQATNVLVSGGFGFRGGFPFGMGN